MKQIKKHVKDFFFWWIVPKTTSASRSEIDKYNLTTMHYLCLIMAIVQSVALTVYSICNINRFDDPFISEIAFNLLASIGIFTASSLAAGLLLRRKSRGGAYTPAVNIFLTVACAAIVFLGMSVSVSKFIQDEQMIIFYTVIFCVAMFLKLRPILSSALITVSYWTYYIYLVVFIKPGMIAVYNYTLLWLLTTAGAIVSYRWTLSSLEHKNAIRKLNKSLELLANHDSLTNLKNRHAFNSAIPNGLNREMYIAMTDIDKFKEINDTLGHAAGDEVLKRVSNIMTEIFSDEHVFRYGGDEFLILAAVESIDDFESMMAEINSRLEKFRLPGSERVIRCSYGYVKAKPANTTEFFMFISEADKKLYENKRMYSCTA